MRNFIIGYLLFATLLILSVIISISADAAPVYDEISVTGTGTFTLTSAKYNTLLTSNAAVVRSQIKDAMISVSGIDIRFRYDGGTPTATGSGHLLKQDIYLTLVEYADIQNFKFIAVSGVGTLSATYNERK